MSVFLTPTLEPFVGGTYFPPEDRYGRPGFKTVLTRITDVWGRRRDEVKESAKDTLRQLREMTSLEPAALAAVEEEGSSRGESEGEVEGGEEWGLEAGEGKGKEKEGEEGGFADTVMARCRGALADR
jgi:hypothetical protein